MPEPLRVIKQFQGERAAAKKEMDDLRSKYQVELQRRMKNEQAGRPPNAPTEINKTPGKSPNKRLSIMDLMALARGEQDQIPPMW